MKLSVWLVLFTMKIHYLCLHSVKSIYPSLTYHTLFKIHKLCLAIHTLNAVQRLDCLGHGHDLDTFGPLMAPHNFKSLHALM